MDVFGCEHIIQGPGYALYVLFFQGMCLLRDRVDDTGFLTFQMFLMHLSCGMTQVCPYRTLLLCCRVNVCRAASAVLARRRHALCIQFLCGKLILLSLLAEIHFPLRSEEWGFVYDLLHVSHYFFLCYPGHLVSDTLCPHHFA